MKTFLDEIVHKDDKKYYKLQIFLIRCFLQDERRDLKIIDAQDWKSGEGIAQMFCQNTLLGVHAFWT